MKASRWSVWQLALAWIVAALLLVTDVAAIRTYGLHAIAEEMRLSTAAAKAHGIANADNASGFVMVLTQEEAARVSRPTRWLKAADNVAGGLALLIIAALVWVTGSWIWSRWRRGQHDAPAV